jgi:Domain of unknown function (DUF4224)
METLDDAELQEITGYISKSQQLNVLHSRGFDRAYRARNGKVILERPHYLAVCRGEFAAGKMTSQPSVNTSFLKRA